MTTLTYGSIIKIISINSNYDNKIFFVEHVDDNEIILVTEENKKEILPLTNGLLDDSINNITVIYKPTDNYVTQNNLFVKQWIEIEFDDSNIVKGQIINIKNYIEVKLKDTVIYLPITRGLPKEIVRITKISKPLNYETKKEEIEEVDLNEEDIPEVAENEILGYIEQEEDTGYTQYFYSIEQQTSDLLENLLIEIPEDKRSPTLLKSYEKIIQRYKELRNKYTEFKDGIKIIKLPFNQILSNTLQLKNKTFMNSTKDIDVYLYPDPENENPITRDYFVEQEDEPQSFISRITNLLNKDSKYTDKVLLYDELTNNYVIHKKQNPKKLLYAPTHYEEVVLFDKESILNKNRYIININTAYSVHSLISYPLSYIDNLKTTQYTSNIIDKSNYAQISYYSFLYNSIQNNVKDIKINNYLLNNNTYVYYENHAATFEKYIEKIIPTLNSYIEIGLDNKFILPFYNVYNCIKQLENLNISELSKLDFITIKPFIKKMVKQYKKNMMIKGLPEKKIDLYTPNNSLENIIVFYEGIIPKHFKDYYYSSSEILKFTNLDYNNYYFKKFIQNEPPTLITEEEIKEVKDEIASMIEKEDIKETIHKLYKTEQERENDKMQKVILKNVDGMSGLEYIYRQLIQFKEKIPTLEKLKLLVDNIIVLDLNIEKIKTNKDISMLIIELINKIKIIDNNLAYVEESNKTYRRINNEWVSLDDPRCFDKKNLVSTKGLCNNTETEYSNRVKILLDNIVEKRERDKLSNSKQNEFIADIAARLLKCYYDKALQDDLKYNNEKEKYGIIELQKEINKINVSPYFNLRDKILNESRLDFKYKAIQLFINKYTKTGPDKYWFYCIETSSKLIPAFFYKLANAFLITNNIELVEEEICLDQGTLSDNGDKWVDKYSGYIIKDIAFDKEEGYDAKGYKVVTRNVLEQEPDKEIFSEEILEELAKDRYVKTLVKILFTYLGVNYVDDDVLYDFIDKTYTTTNSSSKDESTQKIMLLFSIITNVFVYIQTFPTKLKITKPFPNCKFSFAGYPLINDETMTDGLKYVACVIKTLSKGGKPWNMFIKMPEPTIISNLQKMIKQILLRNENIKQLIEKKRLINLDEPDVFLNKKWNNFSPRLKPIKEIRFREQVFNTMDDLKDRIYYLSYLVQKEINNKITSIEPILTDTTLNPYLVNACCNEDNYTYRYFLKNTNIIEYLKEIIHIKKPLRKLEKLLVNEKLYFKENTIKLIPEPTTTFSEDTIYRGIIKWSETKPELLKLFQIPLPNIIKMESLKNKITKMKEQQILINEETFINMLQKSNNIINNSTKKEQELIDETHEIFKLLSNEKELANYLDSNITTFLSKLKKYDTTPKFLNVINFNTTILSNKKNLVIDSKIEHYAHINQILYNKILFLLYTLPEIFYSNKNTMHTITLKHWNLAPIHNKDIKDNATAYYNNLFETSVNEEVAFTLKLIDLDKYKNLIKIDIHNQEIKNLLYYYIFLGIFYEYKNIKFKPSENPGQHKLNINSYLNLVVSIFDRENRLALNFDTSRIKYEVNISKKSETKIKTDYFKSLSKDARKAEGVLKEHKLEKWGVGLQKSMFQYQKETYLKDKLEAKTILENIGIQEDTDINMNEVTEPLNAFEPLDDPNEYASNVDEDYDNESEE